MRRWLAPTLTIFIIYLHIAYIAVPKEWTFLDSFSVDKWIHALMFFSLAFSWRIHLFWFQLNKWMWLIGLLMFGFTMEVMQALLTTYRSREWADVIADTFGVLLAFWFFTTTLFTRLGFSHDYGKYNVGSKDHHA